MGWAWAATSSVLRHIHRLLLPYSLCLCPSQALYNWRKEAMAVLAAGSVLAGIPPMLYLINAPLSRLVTY
jgi:hypothetical protein